MHLRAVTPIVVPPEELARRQARYDAIAPPDVTIHLDNLAEGPDRLESEADIRRSERLVYQAAVATDPDHYDGVFLDCVLDPALEQLRAESPLPVFGITFLVANYLGSLGLTMAGAARNQAIADELRSRIAAAGWSARLQDILVLDLSLEDISDTDRWNQVLAQHTGRLAGVDVVLNGCSAVEVTPSEGPVVVDPTGLALKLIGLGTGFVGGT